MKLNGDGGGLYLLKAQTTTNYQSKQFTNARKQYNFGTTLVVVPKLSLSESEIIYQRIMKKLSKDLIF